MSKIQTYLSSKNDSEYTKQDWILAFCCGQEIHDLLNVYGFYDHDLYFEINDKEKYLELIIKYYNLGATIHFNESDVQYFFYPLENYQPKDEDFLTVKYDDNFDVKLFFADVKKQMNNHVLLKKDSQYQERRKKLGKIYGIISFVCFAVPFMAIFGVSLYVTISGNVVDYNKSACLLALFFFILCGGIFSGLRKKNK